MNFTRTSSSKRKSSSNNIIIKIIILPIVIININNNLMKRQSLVQSFSLSYIKQKNSIRSSNTLFLSNNNKNKLEKHYFGLRSSSSSNSAISISSSIDDDINEITRTITKDASKLAFN